MHIEKAPRVGRVLADVSGLADVRVIVRIGRGDGVTPRIRRSRSARRHIPIATRWAICIAILRADDPPPVRRRSDGQGNLGVVP